MEIQLPTFRNFHDESDFAIMHGIFMESNKADQVSDHATVDDIKNWCAPSERFDPKQDILLALNENGDAVGFSRVSWYTGKDGIKLYTQASFLMPAYRQRGFWPTMVKENERRLRGIAAAHPDRHGCFQSWATQIQKDWIAVLENEGFKAVRHFNNMLHSLEQIPDNIAIDGIEVRPVEADHFRAIWEAQREVQRELFEFAAEQWTDDQFDRWQKDSSHTPDLWQVAWEGDQVVGMVLGRIDEVENKSLDRKRGYTEHVFVRKSWRQRGIAKMLILRCLHALKDRGMEEAELGVDTENESGAFGFYSGMGYQTFSTDIWFRKSMD